MAQLKTWQEALMLDSQERFWPEDKKHAITYEKRRVLSIKTPLPKASLLEKAVSSIKLAFLSLVPSKYFYNRTMKIRGYVTI